MQSIGKLLTLTNYLINCFGMYWASPDKGSSRNASCALNLISTFLFKFKYCQFLSYWKLNTTKVIIIFYLFNHNLLFYRDKFEVTRETVPYLAGEKIVNKNTIILSYCEILLTDCIWDHFWMCFWNGQFIYSRKN